MDRIIVVGLLTVLLLPSVTMAADTRGETEMKTSLKRDGDKVWLEGVAGWFVGDKVSSVHAAQEAVLRAAGHDISYDYLVGVSGLAFRMQVHKQRLCPSSPHAMCGFACVARSIQALPLEVRSFDCRVEGKESVLDVRKSVVESIDRGFPVQYGREEDGIIIGYQNEGRDWICYHPLKDMGRKTFIETTWPWHIDVFGQARNTVPSVKELALEVLEQAVHMAKTEEAEAYYVGFRAWQEYGAALKKLLTVDATTRKESMMGNAWIYECLVQYRSCASLYLRTIAGQFPDGPAGHLLKAAELFDRMAREVLQDSVQCKATVAPYPWQLKEGEIWSDELIAGQITRLENALVIERQAIGEIETALALIKTS